MSKEPNSIQNRGQTLTFVQRPLFLLILLVLPYSVNKFATHFTFSVFAQGRRVLQLEA